VAGAQSSGSNKLITLAIENRPLAEVLNELEKQAGVTFSYSRRRVPVQQKVSLNVQNQPLIRVLEQLLSPLGIQFEQIEAQWVLTPIPKEEASKPHTSNHQPYTVSGYVRDAETGEVLIGAVVMTQQTGRGAVTNGYGFYSLNLPPGPHTLHTTYLGYQTEEVAVESSRELRINLTPAAEELETLTVESGQNISRLDQAQRQATNFSTEDVQQMPALLGEEEVLKGVQMLPGIGAGSDGSALFHVRGGYSDQNLVLLDDAPIYNPSHTLGFFTTIIPETVKNIEVYRGTMPANLGGRLASVIDVRTRDGNNQNFGFMAGIGMATLQLGAEGPIVRNKASYLVSLRQSLLKGYAQSLKPEVSDYNFHDLNVKLNWNPSQRNRYYLSFYSGGDVYEENRSSGLNWGNSALSLRWNHIFNPQLFSNTTLYTSQYNYHLIPDLNQENISWRSGISNLSLKTDFSYFVNEKHQLDFGVSLSGHEFNPGNVENEGELVPDSVNIISKRFAREWVGYLSHEYRPHRNFSLRSGLRLNLWQNVGESFEYSYNEAFEPIDSTSFAKGEVYQNSVQLEPRLSATWLPSSTASLSLHYNRTVQNIHRISNSISPFTNLEVWLPTGPNIAPQTANMLALDYNQQLVPNRWRLQSSIYYKLMEQQIGYKPHAQLLLNPYLEGELRTGRARAWGLETQLHRSSPRLNGWLAYTYSRVQQEFSELNAGQTFAAAHDRPHQLETYATWQAGKCWLFSLNWQWSSGRPFTAPVAYYYYQGSSVPLYDQLHNRRLPAYHRLDVAAEWNLSRPEGKLDHRLKFSFYNLYSRKNPIYFNFNKIEAEDGSLLVPQDKLGRPEYTASQTYLFLLVPSFSYHLRI
jgi:outer membrane receptor for ferrienterochelin and colicin